MKLNDIFLSYALAAVLFSAPALAGQKVAVCHTAGNSGNTLMLNVSANALAAHLAHGDWLPATWYADADGDGFGAIGDPGVVACIQPAGTSAEVTDCDDANAAVNPGLVEVCANGVDDNCNGEIDEGCMSDIEITVSADNAYFIWVDGVPFDGDFASHWQHTDTFTFQLPAGDHSIAVYMEDWGGYAYFAATVRVDGQLVSVTGDGSWLTTGVQWTDSQFRNSHARGINWPAPPADAQTGLEIVPPANWTSPNFDDSAWLAAPTCSYSRLAHYASQTATVWDDFDPLYADGADFVFTSSDCTPNGFVSLPGGGYQYNWSVGLFRHNFSF